MSVRAVGITFTKAGKLLPVDAAAASNSFYQTLLVHDDLRLLTEPAHFAPVPSDWLIAIADVRDSTTAIAEGRYRDVNTVGALAIASLLNVAKDGDVPFVFGGDGAAVLLPPIYRDAAAGALAGTRRLAREQFALRLAVGLVPVENVYATGERLGIAKLRVSEQYMQALFVGRGLARAEELVKQADDGDQNNALRQGISDDAEAAYPPDFSGYSCRWRDVPSPRGESVSLLVQVLGDDAASQGPVFRRVLEAVEQIYGDARARHPIAPAQLRPALMPDAAQREVNVFAAPHVGRSERAMHLLGVLGQTLVTNLWIRIGVQMPSRQVRRWFPRTVADAPPMEWGRYKETIVEASDCQKIDGLLRMVIAGNADQRMRLTAFLEGEWHARRLAYGLHVAPASLMTCLVYQPNGRQVHFVDGAQGGYALAAQALKQRLIGAASPRPEEPVR